MKLTKQSQRRYLNKIVTHATRALKGCSGLGIYLPSLTDSDITYLQQHFTIVRREFLGYVHFEKPITPIK